MDVTEQARFRQLLSEGLARPARACHTSQGGSSACEVEAARALNACGRPGKGALGAAPHQRALPHVFGPLRSQSAAKSHVHPKACPASRMIEHRLKHIARTAPTG